jgi:hypothetical protein
LNVIRNLSIENLQKNTLGLLILSYSLRSSSLYHFSFRQQGAE